MKILVLMSTFNGEKYIRDQLDSLINQVNVDLSILVRDDGSSDGTVDILKEYELNNLITLYEGENLKPANSFFDLINKAPKADYYAFCDQDDVWDKEKLAKAIEKLSKIDIEIPTMYFSKAQLVDQNLNEIKDGVYPTHSYTFGTALLRNNVTGCTVVFNSNLMDYAKKYTPKKVLMHDHWLYLLCLSLGGNVVYDSNSYIRYRQHNNNVLGGGHTLFKTLKRSSFFSNKGLRLEIATQLFNAYSDDIPVQNKVILEKFINYRKNIITKMTLIFSKEVKNKSLLQDIVLVFNILMNKL